MGGQSTTVSGDDRVGLGIHVAFLPRTLQAHTPEDLDGPRTPTAERVFHCYNLQSRLRLRVQCTVLYSITLFAQWMLREESNSHISC